MDKRKITAREIMKDVRAGFSDHELMQKYKLSAQALQSVFTKLVKAGVVGQDELDDRIPVQERTVDLGLFICPACGNIKGTEFTECSRCGYSLPEGMRPADRNKQKESRRFTTTATTVVEKVRPVTQKMERETKQLSAIDPESMEKLTTTVGKFKNLAILGFVGYILAFLAAVGASVYTSTDVSRSIILTSVLGIPAVITAVLYLVVVKAIGESLNVFLAAMGNLAGK